jgi:hypothetical protein
MFQELPSSNESSRFYNTNIDMIQKHQPTNGDHFNEIGFSPHPVANIIPLHAIFSLEEFSGKSHQMVDPTMRGM